MISSITKLNEFILKCEQKLALTTAEKQIYRFYNLHKWLIKNGYVINEKKYNFGKILPKISLIKLKTNIKVVKKDTFFLKYNEYMSYRSKSFFILANSNLLKIFYKNEMIAYISCKGQLRCYTKNHKFKVNGKDLTMVVKSSYEKLFKLSNLYERKARFNEVLFRFGNAPILILERECFYKYSDEFNKFLNRVLCNNPYYNNFPYVLKMQKIKELALYDSSPKFNDFVCELPDDICVSCPEKFNPKLYVEVVKDLISSPYCPKENSFSKCYFNGELMFYAFKKTAVLKLNLNGEKCLIKKTKCGLKIFFNFGNVYFFTSSKILCYGIIDGFIVIKIESRGAHIFCNLGLNEIPKSFFSMFTAGLKLKNVCPLANDLLCLNPIKTLKMFSLSFFILARKLIQSEKEISDLELSNLLLLSRSEIKERVNLAHINKHLIALLPFVSSSAKLSILNLTNLINKLPVKPSLVDKFLTNKSLCILQNELALSDAIEFEQLLNIFNGGNETKSSDYSVIKKVDFR